MSERDALGRNRVVKYVEPEVGQPALNLSGFSVSTSCVQPDPDDICVSADYDSRDHDLLLSPQETKRYIRYAFWLCIISLSLSVILGLAAVTVGIRARNDAAFGFGLNCALDFVSTLVVLWRFSPKLSSAEAWSRERKASIGVALLFILMFVIIMCKAIADIIRRKRPASYTVSIVLACCSLLICIVLAWAKLVLATRLKSPSLRTDGMNTFAGALIALGVIISWLVVQHHPDVWYVDSFVGLLVGLGMFLYAVRVLAVMMSPEALRGPVYKW